VRDAARKAPDAFHLLRLPQLLLAIVQVVRVMPVADAYLIDRSRCVLSRCFST
jgi:hypothetical protein